MRRMPDDRPGRGCVVNAAALTIAGVIALGFVAAIYRAGRRIKQADAQCERIIAETLTQPASTRAVLDTEPGIDIALRDECDRILAATDDAGFDRLRAAIRDEQTGEAPDA